MAFCRCEAKNLMAYRKTVKNHFRIRYGIGLSAGGFVRNFNLRRSLRKPVQGRIGLAAVFWLVQNLVL